MEKQSVPVVPWNAEQSSILSYEPFILLLHQLGLHLPADGEYFMSSEGNFIRLNAKFFQLFSWQTVCSSARILDSWLDFQSRRETRPDWS